MDGSDPAAGAPFERLSGGPGEARDGGGGGGKQPLLARLVTARAQVAARWGPAGATPKAFSSSRGGGLADPLLLEDEGDGEATATTTTAAATAPPQLSVAPPSPPARLKLLIHERLQQLKGAIGPEAKAGSAAAATATTTPAAARALRGRDLLLPECAAALLTRGGDDETPLAFLCPLTLELMADPVVAPDGWTYERAAIASRCSAAAVPGAASGLASSTTRPQRPWQKKAAPPVKSPMTGEPMPLSGRGPVAFVPNRVLAAMILEWGEREGRRQKRQAEAEATVKGGGGATAAP